MSSKPTPTNTKCSICDKTLQDIGHNASPVNDGRCCTKCNFTKVIPARLELLDIYENIFDEY